LHGLIILLLRYADVCDIDGYFIVMCSLIWTSWRACTYAILEPIVRSLGVLGVLSVAAQCSFSN